MTEAEVQRLQAEKYIGPQPFSKEAPAGQEGVLQGQQREQSNSPR
jgi:hypothetical protein